MPAELTRAKLVKATASVMRDRGLSGTTIREIAKQAGVAEGALYRHFSDKVDLIMAVMLEEWPTLGAAMAGLLDRVGKGTVRGNLRTLVVEAMDGYRELVPFAATIAGDQAVLTAVREHFAANNIGPARAHDAMVMYLTAEAERGRVELAAPPEVISAALLGACHEHAFLRLLHTEPPFGKDAERFARDLVKLLLP
ncbi:MAG TPA: helix-turn-helix domain-containing protein [Streptosporangiaceae bacterium]